MKKFTLYFLIFFAGIVTAIFVMGLLLPDNSTPSDLLATNNGSKTILTATEVAKHNTKTDCYLIVNDQVYDVTAFIDQHPGGVEKIVEGCGKESSQIFAAIHSNFAWNLLKDYYVGDLAK